MFGRHTQTTLTTWADDAFHAGSALHAAAVANEKLAAVVRHLASDSLSRRAAEDAADAVILLVRLCTRLGHQLNPPPALSRACRPTLYASHAVSFLAKAISLLEACPGHFDACHQAEGAVHSLSALCQRLGTTLEFEVDHAVSRARAWRVMNGRTIGDIPS